MKNFKRKVVTWIIIGIVSLVAVIFLSVLLSIVSQTLKITSNIILEYSTLVMYRSIRAYSIGGIVFLSLLVVMSVIIAYAGIRSWRYSDMVS